MKLAIVGINYDQFLAVVALDIYKTIERTKVRINAKEVDVNWDVSSGGGIV